MTASRYSAVGQFLLWAVFVGPACYAYFVWHWPLVRIVLLCLFAFGLLLGCLFSFGALFSEIAKRRRTKVMIQAAKRLDLKCYPGPFHLEWLPAEARNSNLLRSADAEVRNLLHGTTPDADVKIFDAYLTVAAAESRPWTADNRPRNVIRRFEQTVTCVTSPKLRLPRFSILLRPTGDNDSGLSSAVSFDLGELFRGLQRESKVELPAASTLSERYDFWATDPQATRRVLNRPVVSLLETQRNLSVCCEGPVILLFRENRLADIDDVETLLQTALRLAKEISAPTT